MTQRLKLRLYKVNDVDALLGYYSQQDVARYLLEEVWQRPFAEQQIKKRLQRRGLETDSGALALVCEYQGQVIGDVALWLTDETRQAAEVGWVMNPEFGGKGLATEAVRAVLDLAFGVYDLHRVAAQMDARNGSSAKLCRRLGMQQEAHLRQNWWSKGEWTDTLIYGLLAADRGE